MNKKSIIVSVLGLLALPVVALAIVPPPIPVGVAFNPWNLVDLIFTWFIWPVAVAYIIIMFIMAGFAFLNAKGEPGALEKARSFVIYGVVGIGVILLSFSMIFVVKNVLGV